MILNRSLDAVMPPYRALFKRFDITEQQWRVLRVLWAHERVNSAELASMSLIPASSLVGIIDRLERKNLVSRRRSERDRRVVYVAASSSGRALEADVSRPVAAIHRRIRSAVSAEEWDCMIATLAKIDRTLQGDEPATHKTSNTTNRGISD